MKCKLIMDENVPLDFPERDFIFHFLQVMNGIPKDFSLMFFDSRYYFSTANGWSSDGWSSEGERICLVKKVEDAEGNTVLYPVVDVEVDP